MTSIEIAEVTGKQHKNVMQAIRNMEPAWEKVNGLKFQLVEYRDKKGELRPCYSLTKTECLYIATKFNDEARAKLVLRWEQLERERLVRTSMHAQGSYELTLQDYIAAHNTCRLIFFFSPEICSSNTGHHTAHTKSIGRQDFDLPAYALSATKATNMSVYHRCLLLLLAFK